MVITTLTKSSLHI